MQFETVVHCRLPRVACPEHGVKTLRLRGRGALGSRCASKRSQSTCRWRLEVLNRRANVCVSPGNRRTISWRGRSRKGWQSENWSKRTCGRGAFSRSLPTLFQCTSSHEASTSFNVWLSWVQKSALPPMKRLAGTFSSAFNPFPTSFIATISPTPAPRASIPKPNPSKLPPVVSATFTIAASPFPFSAAAFRLPTGTGGELCVRPIPAPFGSRKGRGERWAAG